MALHVPRPPGRRRVPRRATIFVAFCAVASAVGVVAATGTAAASSHRSRPYMIGDSITAWSEPQLRAVMPSSSRPVIVGAPCRGLVVSCRATSKDARPPTGLAVIRALRGRLGRVVVIELGYNDTPGKHAIDKVMKELHRQHVRRVLWINLSERQYGYRSTNRALASAAPRWSELRILDWRTYSKYHGSWFIDGVHLTGKGKIAFARFVAAALRRVS